MGFKPRGRYLSLKTGIWALKIGFGPQGGGDGEEEGGEGESFPYVWKQRSPAPSGPLPKNDLFEDTEAICIRMMKKRQKGCFDSALLY